MDIVILYGTETGNAEMLAEDIESGLSGEHDIEVVNLSDFEPGSFDPAKFYLVVSSTYGDGELPTSAKPFALAMETEKPDLSGVAFAIFGLGDSEYETYNLGSQILQALLEGAGATLVGARVTHDASGSDLAEDLALPWARDVIALSQARMGAAA